MDIYVVFEPEVQSLNILLRLLCLSGSFC